MGRMASTHAPAVDRSGLRLMHVHAHPDDESSKGAATMAHYVRQGVEVMVATCTGGERGSILNAEMEGHPHAERDLTGLRRHEMAQAAAAERDRLVEQTRREIDMRLRIARRELTEHATHAGLGRLFGDLVLEVDPGRARGGRGGPRSVSRRRSPGSTCPDLILQPIWNGRPCRSGYPINVRWCACKSPVSGAR